MVATGGTTRGTEARSDGMAVMPLRGAVADYTRFKGRECLISGPAGSGKAQPYDAHVMTPDGPEFMGSIEVGDVVLTPDGGSANVIQVHEHGDQDVYRVTTSDGAVVECTADHLWLVDWFNDCKRPKGESSAIMTTGQIAGKLSDKRKIFRIPLAVTSYSERELPIEPYVLGVLIGDGCTRADCVTIMNPDRHITDKVSRLVEDDKHELRAIKSAKDTWVIGKKRGWKPSHASTATACGGIWGHLQDLGLRRKYSYEKFIPPMYLYGSIEQRWELVRGIMDTDGWVDGDSGQPVLTTTSRVLAEDFRELVLSLGGLSSIRRKITSYNGKQRRDAYNCWVSHPNAKMFFSLPRKRDKAKIRKSRVRRYIVSVEKTGREPCRCITLDSEDGLYITNDHVVTHNSFGIASWNVVLISHYPGMRILMGRKTRASMTQSVLVTWEKVLTASGLGKVCSGQQRSHRSSYVFPNKVEVVVAGFDDPERIKSSEYDLIWVNEVNELTVDDLEVALSRLRNGKMPWQMFVGDCNPDAPTHWLRSRVEQGLMTEYVSLHKDNPAYWDRKTNDWTDSGRNYYENVLQGLTGVRRERLVLGLWVAAEGAVFADSWNRRAHLADPDEVPELHQYIAGVDFGWKHPGVISVYGVDSDGNLWRVREIYRQKKAPYWWHAQARRLMGDYPNLTFVCDGSRPELVDAWNASGLWAFPAEKGPGSVELGIRLIESALHVQGNGKPGLRFVRGAVGYYDDSGWSDGPEPYDPSELASVAREPSPMDMMDVTTEGGRFGRQPYKPSSPLGDWIPSVCPLQSGDNKPTCTEDEFYVYSWEKQKDGQIIKEVPRKEYDDGMDSLRYVLRHLSEGGGSGGVSDEDLTPYGDPYVEAMLN